MKIIAHRSGPTLFPEQTVASAEQALQDGADLVELDVRFTADKAVVVCHDSNAERVFGDKRKIGEMTETEFSALRHKNAPAYSAHRFTDYLQSSIKPLLIHVKEDDVLPLLIQHLNDYRYTDSDVVFGIGNSEAVKTIRALRPNAQILAFMKNADCAESFLQVGANYIRLWEDWLTPDTKPFSVPTWIMTNGSEVGVTTEENLRRILSLHPDGILINDVRMLNNLME
ncbi:MAG TPA: hypothetical protein DDY98_04595 [Ruminococcaceae bacterium]|nr:hypothetical protein [Oscillospiraceae bacterium]